MQEKINDNYFPISSNIQVHDNTLEMGDAFPVPAFEHHIGKLLVAIEEKLNAQDASRKKKRIPFIMYDGVSKNMLTNGTVANPDSICIKQTGDNMFVNADFMHLSDPKNWHPDTNMNPFVCN